MSILPEINGYLSLFQQEDLDSIVAQVAALDRFVEIPAAHHVGWNGSFFAQHDGTISGAGVEHVHVLFVPQSGRTSSAGTLADWKRQVAVSVSKHPLVAFAVMAMFSPPVLRLMPGARNPVFEFVAARNSGKSAMLKLAGSVVGSMAYGRPLIDVQQRFDEVIADMRVVLSKPEFAVLPNVWLARASRARTWCIGSPNSSKHPQRSASSPLSRSSDASKPSI